MSPSLKARHLPRYGELGRLLVKHRGAIRLAADGRPEPGTDTTAEDAKAFAQQLEELGPTFIKLGQLLSTRSDLLPAEYLAALVHLQDDVAPLPYDVAREIVESELGVRVSTAFSSFEEEPLASASLGQVHRACLRDGRAVAVKVQRPGVREQIVEDMAVIDELAEFVERHGDAAGRLDFRAMVEQFRRSTLDELDYRVEAANLVRLGEDLADYDLLVIPQPVHDYTSERVLTMELLDGRNVGSIPPIGQIDIDGAPMLEELFSAYLDQVLIHGFFHADPHPGNILLTSDGRLGVIDLGMVAHVAPGTRTTLLRLLLAMGDGRGEEVAGALEELGEPLEDYQPRLLRREASDLVMRSQGADLSSLRAGTLLGELARVAGQCGLRPAPELTMLMKALLNLDEVARALDPTFEPNAAIREHATDLMQRHMLGELSPRRLLGTALDTKEFVENLPARLNKVMDSVADGRFSLNIQGFDDPELMRGFQKLANRVTVGIVTAALVVAAALFSGSHGTQVLGYPVLTVVFLGFAATSALWLAVNVFRADVRRSQPATGGRGRR
ncbi:MAG TPA: AarF/UbiB family protein [Acidimicrobiales bacterium]|nr:AarF/UbiB family protein [Acidimicrobiales bacterium]